MSECERFPQGSRLRAICDGTADMPLSKINAYRNRWGLDSFHGPDRPPTKKPVVQSSNQPVKNTRGGGCRGCGGRKSPAKPNGHGPGSQLLKLLDGMPHCDACIDLAGRMDRWGKRGCERKIELIVEDILPRAVEWMQHNHPWIQRILSAASLDKDALRIVIRKKVRQAIDNTQEPVKKQKWRPAGGWASAFRPGGGSVEYLTAARLSEDTMRLIPKLPPDVSRVIGVARSGLAPATLLAMMLHLPLSILRQQQGDLVEGGNGWRIKDNRKTGGKILVVDDTAMTGNSLRSTKHALRNVPGDKIYAAVYVNPLATAKPDVWVHDLPWPHLLEWNLFNSVLLDSFATDFDGILCHDCAPADDDDGERYLRWMESVPPLHLVRKGPIRLIVTARLEKYRPQTLAWMNRWGVRAKEIVMGPWRTVHERRRDDVAAWKANQLKRFLGKRSGIHPKFFIESDVRQAERIAKLTGRLVVCPAARRCFGDAK